MKTSKWLVIDGYGNTCTIDMTEAKTLMNGHQKDKPVRFAGRKDLYKRIGDFLSVRGVYDVDDK